MVVTELRKTFEDRRSNLISLLENPESNLDLTKQHQIYGAIKEIENFLRTLDHYREMEMNEGSRIDLNHETEEGVFARLGALFKR